MAGKPLKIKKCFKPHKKLIFTKPEGMSRRGRPPVRWLESAEQDAQILEMKLEDHSRTQEELRQSGHVWAQVPQKNRVRRFSYLMS